MARRFNGSLSYNQDGGIGHFRVEITQQIGSPPDCRNCPFNVRPMRRAFEGIGQNTQTGSCSGMSNGSADLVITVQDSLRSPERVGGRVPAMAKCRVPASEIADYGQATWETPEG